MIMKINMPVSPTRASLLSLQRPYSLGLPLAGTTLPRWETCLQVLVLYEAKAKWGRVKKIRTAYFMING